MCSPASRYGTVASPATARWSLPAPHRRARDVLARIHAGWKLTNDIQREKKALRAPGRALRTGGESHRQFGEYLGSVIDRKEFEKKNDREKARSLPSKQSISQKPCPKTATG